jgi:nucleoside-diphosphate-sugar epimerase
MQKMDKEKIILIMEDEQAVGISLMRKLNETYVPKGYRAELAIGPKTALDLHKKLIREEKQVCLIIADFNMMYTEEKEEKVQLNNQTYTLEDGIKYVIVTKRIFPDCKTILYTGKATPKTPIEAINSDSVDRYEEKDPRDEECKKLFSSIDKLLTDYERYSTFNFGSGIGKDIIITGATGHLGRLFTTKILKGTDAKVFLIGRGKDNQSLEDRLTYIPKSDFESGRIVPINWDLGSGYEELKKDKNFGKLLTAEDAEFWHIAAFLSFDNNDAEKLNLVNVEGTRKLLDLVFSMKNPIRAFNYIGTAFDSGIAYAPQEVWEDGQGANKWLNYYELSKARAACLLKGSNLPFRIFKPSIITDDLTTETTTSDETIYGFAKAMHFAMMMAKKKNPEITPNIRFAGDPDSGLNYVPINYVTKMMIGVRNADPAMTGKTYHTVGRGNVPTKLYMDVLGGILGFNYEFVSERPGTYDSSAEQLYYKKVDKLYAPYMFKNGAIYRMDNVVDALGKEFIDSIPIIGEKELRFLLTKYLKNRANANIVDGKVRY